MIVELSENAQQDIKDFMKNTLIQTEMNITKYVSGLLDYIEILATLKYLGKVLLYIRNIEIRQLLYQKHRIIYYIETDKIIILSIVHTSRDIDKYIDFLKENM